MRLNRAIAVVAVIQLWLANSLPAFAAPPVDMVLLAEPSAETAINGRRWAELLTGLGVGGVQIRGEEPTDRPGIEVGGTKQSPVYHITARLAGNQLVLPGGRFRLSDHEALAKWLGELGENGTAGVTEKKGAFGLLAAQLAEVRDDLAQPVTIQTKGLPATEAVEKIAAALKLKLAIDPAVEKALAADDPVRDEFSGLSSGTALAAITRPAGTVLRPQKPAGGELGYVLAKAAGGAEAWPIGWPPEESEGKILPQLLESLNVEIRNVSLAQAIDAIQGRLKVPFLLDHNALARQRIDLKKTVSLPTKRSFYGIILRQVLAEGGLTYSVRVDEAGKPLVWITSVRGK